MEETRPTGRTSPAIPSMPHAMGRGAREDIVWEALERIDGKPAPAVGSMQAAMGNEAQIQLVHDVIRAYLDHRDATDTREWVLRAGGAS